MKKNKNIIEEEILKKKSSSFYAANKNIIKESITDYDSFPYMRWYKGRYDSENPIIAEREVGWFPRQEKRDYVEQYFPREQREDTNSGICFKAACSTIYPCSESKIINNKCIISYR